MSFCFNFDVSAQTDTAEDTGGNKRQSERRDHDAEYAERADETPAGPVKEAKEHLPPTDPHFLLTDAIAETVTIGALPALHFLNETVFERTASEREDGEKILSRREEKNSDLISGVYEGGLKVWECTYDVLELMEKEGETFSGRAVLDLGCGAGLLGILALKRGARHVLFQDYNSTVVEQLTVPNVILNCQEDDDVESEGEKKGKGKKHEDDSCVAKQDSNASSPPPKKGLADLSQHPLIRRCRFYSGDWRTFLPLVLKEEPQPKFDIIFTSETIYNTCHYPALHETLHRLLAPSGLVYLATKSHYFGVGGGLHLFETFVEQRGVFHLDRLWDGAEGLQRHVVVLRFKQLKDN
uniref:protein-histidine N-methyltransferase n=1 Tax=Fundulus heteroclitus TaxID=8078 RepID=A0A3Q2Q919_FUNHE